MKNAKLSLLLVACCIIFFSNISSATNNYNTIGALPAVVSESGTFKLNKADKNLERDYTLTSKHSGNNNKFFEITTIFNDKLQLIISSLSTPSHKRIRAEDSLKNKLTNSNYKKI